MIIDEDTGELDEAVTQADADSSGRRPPPESDEATLRLLHQTIKKVGDDIESFGFNTAISQMMIFVNHLSKQRVRPKSVVENFVLILAPFAPHIAEELWQRLGHTESLAYEPWPQYDSQLIKEKEIELAVQVNGKIRDRIVVAADANDQQIQSQALISAKVNAAMGGKPPKKIRIVKPRIVSIIT
jgi:leucyl-tRNA synthetase